MAADPTRPLGLAVIGCGRVAPYHVEAILAQPALGRLVATVDVDADKAAAFGAQHGARHTSSDLSEILALDEVDAVILCTPNALHTENTLQALQAKKHVLVEKPFAETSADARRMAAAADTADLTLAAGHTFRHCPAVRHLQDHVADYGRLISMEVSLCVFWDGPQAPWWADRTLEEGLILSLFAPHALDFVQVVMGQADPVRVQVEAARHQSGWQGEDEAMMLLRYPDRQMVSVHVSYNQPHVVDRKSLFFENGVLTLENGETLKWNDELLVASPPPRSVTAHALGRRDLSGYFRLQLAEFVAAVRGHPHRSVLHHDARRLIELIDRVKQGARPFFD